MSRCLPYPPPGWEKSLGLIEPIKKEREQAKKDKKNEKKKRRYEELSQSAKKHKDSSCTGGQDEGEQLEKSSVTEEQGASAAVQSLCDSSDSAQNTRKRIKHESAEVIRTTPGNGLRIRLPLLRHKNVESPASRELRQEPGSAPAPAPATASRASSSVEQQPHLVGVTGKSSSSVEHPCSSGRAAALPAEPRPEQPCSSGRTDVTGRKSGRDHRRCRGGSHEERWLYRKLTLEWNPPPFGTVSAVEEDDPEDWLFGKKNRNATTGGARPVEDPRRESALCAWPPRACYLPEVDVYALPYVVPF